jgi:hypothetical protein
MAAIAGLTWRVESLVTRMIKPVTPDLVVEAVWHLDEPMSELSTGWTGRYPWA